MKNLSLPFAAVLSLLLLACNPQQPTENHQIEEQKPCLVRAAEGQQVHIFLNHIKTEKRADFESFVNDVLFPALAVVKDEKTKKAFKSARYLEPTAQNADSSWTYSFVFDPYYKEVDYNLMTVLKSKYAEEEVTQYLEALSTCYVSPQEGFGFVQAGK